ncbi:hypothetical protein BpHYR1_039055 [Brachionus plicatilis]|uniref:Uncharacterized protein n=1 Tax=Brachionus plicatilis TaxID=10195 RepID=A0A3M7S375_BRAPC|nr:hypothetical protein BpHYR1_039055 [Brachionus plicatilis]
MDSMIPQKIISVFENIIIVNLSGNIEESIASWCPFYKKHLNEFEKFQRRSRKKTYKIASFEKKLDFDKFAYVSNDSNLATRGMLSEAEIVDSIATNYPVEQDSDGEIEKQQDANKQVINSKEA